jgi:hypothetical protein
MAAASDRKWDGTRARERDDVCDVTCISRPRDH